MIEREEGKIGSAWTWRRGVGRGRGTAYQGRVNSDPDVILELLPDDSTI